MHLDWPHPHSVAAELEINGTHGEFHTHMGRDEKIKTTLLGLSDYLWIY